MFFTCNVDQVPMPSGLCPLGIQYWWYVGKEFNSIWFLVNHETTQNRQRRSFNLFVSTPRDIVQLAEMENSKITEVQIATPKHLNDQGRWVMEPLIEIWEGLEPTSDIKQTAHLYVAEAGMRYTDSWHSTQPESLLDLKLVYRHRRTRRRAPKSK
jgi:hypothetical protein